MTKVKVIGELDYVMGHLRYGHYEVEMDPEVFKSMSKEDLKEHLQEQGELIIDDYSIEDSGDITNIRLG